MVKEASIALMGRTSARAASPNKEEPAAQVQANVRKTPIRGLDVDTDDHEAETSRASARINSGATASASRPKGVYGQTLDKVGLQIVEGAIAPGSVLDPDALQRDLGVSRTVVREVLRVLATKGLIGSLPRRGTTVQARSAWGLLDPDILRWQFESNHGGSFLDDLMELRELIEPRGAGLAAQRRSAEDLGRLEGILAEMTAAGRDGEAFIAADIDFHRALLQAAHNELLFQLHEVVDVGLLARDRFVQGVREWEEAIPEHAAIVAAVKAADSRGAEKAVRTLLERATQDVVRARERGGSDRAAQA
jgi:GntR family galactonate operon transcriptional repressor